MTLACFHPACRPLNPGTLRDAIFYSTSANQFHGLPRTNADKRNQVELLLQDEEWQKMSDRAIAEHCGVSGPFVGKVRAELARSSTANISSERVDKRGRKLDTSNIGAKSKEKSADITYESVPDTPRSVAEAAHEAIEDMESSALHPQSNGAVNAADMLAINERNGVIATAPQLETTGIAQSQPFNQLQSSEAALHEVAENQIELLSKRMGAKAVAFIALDFCTPDEIKEIYADLSSGLEKLEEQD